MIARHTLGWFLSVVTRRRGKKIWDSAKTIKHFEKDWYENPARLRVYDLIASAYKPGVTLADAGCGVGFDTERILDRFCGIYYTGIDASQKMLDRCGEKFGYHSNAKFEKGDILDLNYDDRSFDIVISCNVMVHITGFATALRELCRICDHHLILQFNYIDENGDYLQGLSPEEFDMRFLDKRSNMYFVYYNPQEIIDLCSSFGLKKVYKGNFPLDKYKREATVLYFTRGEDL